MYMYEHFNNIRNLYGKAYVQMPNGIFNDLAKINQNIQQISFCFSYLVTIAFLYKYAHFVDLDNGTYVQNSDIKQILGYNKTTKTIDKFIKKNGVLEELGLIATTKDYPVEVEYTEEKVNNINMREFKTISMLNADNIHYNMIKGIVKNRNYEIREPLFFFEYNDDIGTLYNYENTFEITLDEFMMFVYEESLDNTDFFLYCYLKSKCYGLKYNMKQMALVNIINDLCIGKDAFYGHLNKLKEKGFVEVNHKGWRTGEAESEIEANDYYFKGIR